MSSTKKDVSLDTENADEFDYGEYEEDESDRLFNEAAKPRPKTGSSADGVAPPGEASPNDVSVFIGRLADIPNRFRAAERFAPEDQAADVESGKRVGAFPPGAVARMQVEAALSRGDGAGFMKAMASVTGKDNAAAGEMLDKVFARKPEPAVYRDAVLELLSGNPGTEQGFADLQKRCAAGDKQALLSMALIAGGWLDLPGQNGASPSKKALEALTALPKTGDLQPAVLQALLMANTMGQPMELPTGNGALLPMIADLAQKDEQSPAYQRAYNAIASALRYGASEPGSPLSVNASAAFMKLAKNWQPAEAALFVSQLTPQQIDGLRQEASRIPEGVKNQVVNALYERHDKSKPGSEERKLSLSALDALGMRDGLSEHHLKKLEAALRKSESSGDRGKQFAALKELARLEKELPVKVEKVFKDFAAPQGKADPDRVARVELVRALSRDQDKTWEKLAESRLSPEKLKAAAELLSSQLQSGKPISVAQGTFVLAAFKDSHVAGTKEMFASLLAAALQGSDKETKERLGKAVAEDRLYADSKVLTAYASLLSSGAMPEKLQAHFDDLKGSDRQKAADALLVLSAVAAVKNTDGAVKPNETTQKALAALEEYGTTGDGEGRALVDAIIKTSNRPEMRSQPMSELILLAARVSSKMPAEKVDPRLVGRVSQDFEKALNQPNSADSRNQREAFLLMAPQWDNRDARSFVRVLGPKSGEELAAVFDKLSPGVKREAIHVLCDLAKANVEASPQAIAVLKKLGEKMGAEGVMTFKQLGLEAPIKFEDPLAKPSAKEYERLWKREYGDRLEFPERASEDGKEAGLFHRGLWLTQARNHFEGDPNALQRLKTQVYEDMAFTGGENVSLREVYCQTQFIENVQAYERAVQSGDKRAQHLALVDLLALQKSPVMRYMREVEAALEKYLNNEQAAGRIKEQDVTAAFQEVQRRNREAERKLSETIAATLTEEGQSAERYRELRLLLAKHSSEAGLESKDALGGLVDVLRLREAKAVLKVFEKPDAEKNPANLAELEKVLYSTGLGQSLQEAIRDGKLPEVLAAIKEFVNRPDQQLLERQTKYLRNLPVSALDAMNMGAFAGGHGQGSEARNGAGAYAALRQVQDSLKKLGPDGATAANAKELAVVLKDIDEFQDTAVRRRLEEALGGAGKLKELIAGLETDGTHKDAYRKLLDAIATKPVKEALGLLDAVADNPNMVTSAKSQAEQLKALLDPKTLNYLSEDPQYESDPASAVRDLESVIGRWKSGAAALGGGVKDALPTVQAALAVRQLQLAVSSSNPVEINKALASGLQNLLEAGQNPRVKAVIDALGGKGAVEVLLKAAKSGDPKALDAKFVDAIAGKLSSPAVTRLMQDAGLLTRLPHDTITKPFFSDAERLDKARCYVALQAGHYGLYRDTVEKGNAHSLVRTIDQLLSLKDSALGRQALEKLGGAEELAKLRENVVAGSRSGNFDRANEQLRAISEKSRGKDFDNLYQKLEEEIQSSFSFNARNLLGRPDISRTQVAEAVEGLKARETALNAEYDRLEKLFLARPQHGETVGDIQGMRENALSQIERFGLASFVQGGDDRRMVTPPELRAIHTLQKISDATDAAGKAKALRELADLADSGNLIARRWLADMRAKGRVEADYLVHALERGAPEAQARAIKDLNRLLPDAAELMDNVRSRACVRDLINAPEPKVGAYDAARKALEAEAALNNKSATEWIKWVDANREVARLSALGGGVSTPEDRKQAVESLTKQMNAGNVYARDALFAALTANTNYDSALGTQGREPKTPDLSHLKPEERRALTLQMLDGIEKKLAIDGPKARLSVEETHALAIAIAHNSGDADMKARTASIVDRVYRAGGGEDIVDGLIWTMAEKGLPEKGRQAVADLVIKVSDHREFHGWGMSQITKMAADKDAASMYVIAGLLGKESNPYAVDAQLKQVVPLLENSPEHAATFTQAMIDRHKVGGDQGHLLETLGRVAANPQAKISDALIKDARTEVRAGFERCFRKSDGKPDPAFAPSLASASRGLGALVKHWEAEDVGRLTRHLTPETAEGIKLASKDVPEAFKDMLVKGVMDRLRNSNHQDKEWIPALQAIASLAPYVQLSQLKEITAFQQIAPESDRALQLQLSRSILAFVNNGNKEVQAAAADHFTRTGWAQQLGPEVTKELVKYAQGKDVNPELLGRISELAYEAGIKPPISHLLKSLGLKDVDKAQLEKAIETAGGDAKFRDILARVVTYDSLPKTMQEMLKAGTTDISKLQGPDLMPMANNRGEQTDLAKLVEGLAAGKVPDQYKFLVGDQFDANVKSFSDAALKAVAERSGTSPDRLQFELTKLRMQALTGAHVEIKDKEADAAKDSRKKSLEKLCEKTKEGHDTSLWWLALGAGGYLIRRQYNVSKFEAEQKGLIEDFKGADAELSRVIGDMRRLQAVNELTDLSRATEKQFRLGAAGDRLGADKLLLQMGAEYSMATLMALSPHAHRQLTGFGLEPWQQGAWNRMYLNGLVGTPMLTQLPFNQKESVQEGLAVLTSPNLETRLSKDDPRLWMGDYRDITHGARTLRAMEAIRCIDSHPAVADVTNASAELTKTYGDLEKLVAASIQGHRGPDMVNYVRGLVSREENGQRVGMEACIEKIQKNLPQVREVITQLKSEVGNISDPEAKKAIEKRIETLQKMCDSFDYDSPQMQQFREMARLVKSGSMDESTFWTLVRDNIIPIAGTIAIAALVVATCGAATPLAIIGGACLMAAGGLLFREGYAEFCYQMDWNGTGGSQAGDCWRRSQKEKGLRDSGFLVFDAHSGKFRPGPELSDVLINYGIQFGSDVIMNLALMGFGSLVGKGLRAVSGVEGKMTAQALEKLLGTAKSSTAAFETAAKEVPEVTKALWKRWLGECGNQVAFAMASHATEDALKHGFKAQNFFTQIAAALIVCAGHQGIMHGSNYGAKGFVPKWLKPNHLEVVADRSAFMTQMQERVAKLNKDMTAADPNSKPITIKEMPNGNIRCTVDGHVFDFTCVPPAVAIARAQAEARALAEGSGKSDVTETTRTPDGQPHGWEARRVELAPGKEAAVNGTPLSERAKLAREQMDQWTDLTVKGNYAEAAEHTLNAAKAMEADGKATVKFIEVEVPAGKLKENIGEILQKMGGEPGHAEPGVTGTKDHVDITIARPKVVLSDGTKVDLTQISVERGRLKDHQRAELDTLLSSHEGQQLLQRMARQQMEEVICHANRILGGDRPLSATQVQFSQAVAGEHPEGLAGKESLNGGADRHRAALKGQHDAKIAEQEVLAMMFERGAKWSDIAAVAANGKHAADRATFLEYLKHTHCKDAGIHPDAVPGQVRLPGAPSPHEIGSGSQLPRTLLGEKPPTEITPADRLKVEETRTALGKQIDEASLPTNVADALRMMIPREVAPTTKPADLVKQAKDLALLHDILNVPPEIRVHVIDQLLAKGAPASRIEQALATARTCVEMQKSGVPLEAIKKISPDALDQICAQMETVPARIREAFLDPVLKKGFDAAEFELALTEARKLSRLSPAGQLEHLSAQAATTGGAKGLETQELLLKTARDVLNSKEYMEAKAKAPNEREAEQNRLVEAMEKTMDSLGVPKEKWDATAEALKKASRPEDIAAVVRDSLPAVREVFEPTKPADLADRKPFGRKEDDIRPAIERAGEEVRVASDLLQVAKSEALVRQAELEALIKPEAAKIKTECERIGERQTEADCQALALAKGSSHPDSPIAIAQRRVLEAQAKVAAAREALDQALESSAKAIGDKLAILKGASPEFGAIAVKLQTEPTAKPGLIPGTRDIVVTPEILKLPPEHLVSFLAREAGRAKLEMELATQLAYGHNPGNQVKGQPDKADVAALRETFLKQTGTELSNSAATAALKMANELGSAGKLNDAAMADMLGAYKSPKIKEFNDTSLAAIRTRVANEDVNAGNSRSLLQKMAGDEAFAREALGEPLPSAVKNLVERARAGEEINPVTAQKTLREALDARLAELNQRLKVISDSMSVREKSIVADGQSGGTRVQPQLATRLNALEKALVGTEPWKIQATEAIKALQGRNSIKELAELVKALEVRVLKETNQAAYEAARARLGDKAGKVLRALELIEQLGDKAPSIDKIFKSEKPFDLLEKVTSQIETLELVRTSKDPRRKELSEAILLKCIKDLIPLEPLLLKGSSEENLRVIDQLLKQHEALTQALQGKNSDFDGLGKTQLHERLLHMRQTIEKTFDFTMNSKVLQKPGQTADVYARLKDAADAIQTVTELAKAGQTERAQALADLAGCGREFPPLSFPFRALTEAAKTGPKDVLEFVRARFMEAGAPPDHVSVETLLVACSRGVKGYEDWIFIPTGGQSMADHANMDGIFVKMSTGEARPIDFFGKGGDSKLAGFDPNTKTFTPGKDFWAKDSTGHSNAETLLRDPAARAKAENYVAEFMQSTEKAAAETGTQAAGSQWWVHDHTPGLKRFWEATPGISPFKDAVPRFNENAFPIKGSTGFDRDFLIKVGFPPFKQGHDPNTVLTRPQDIEAQTKAYKDYYDKLCVYMREVYAKDGVIPAHVAQLAESVQRRLVMGRGSEIQVNTIVDRMFEPIPGSPPAWQPGPNPGEIQNIYSTRLDTGSTITDFMGNPLKLGLGQHMAGVRLTPDGNVVGVGSNKRPYPCGKLADVLELAVQKQGKTCSYNPSTDNVAALRRAQQQLAFVREELAAGRQLDYSKPPLSDLPQRLGR